MKHYLIDQDLWDYVDGMEPYISKSALSLHNNTLLYIVYIFHNVPLLGDGVYIVLPVDDFSVWLDQEGEIGKLFFHVGHHGNVFLSWRN